MRQLGTDSLIVNLFRPQSIERKLGRFDYCIFCCLEKCIKSFLLNIKEFVKIVVNVGFYDCWIGHRYWIGGHKRNGLIQPLGVLLSEKFDLVDEDEWILLI